MSVRIEGLDKVLNELNKEVNKIEGRTMAGLRAAGLHVQLLSQKQAPYRLGDMVRSAYTRPVPEGGLAVEVGYSSAYALFVHEMAMVNPGQPRSSPYPGVLWGPAGKRKFLEDAMNESSRQILDLVASYVGVGLK